MFNSSIYTAALEKLATDAACDTVFEALEAPMIPAKTIVQNNNTLVSPMDNGYNGPTNGGRIDVCPKKSTIRVDPTKKRKTNTGNQPADTATHCNVPFTEHEAASFYTRHQNPYR